MADQHEVGLSPTDPDPDENRFWIFVDLKAPGPPPEYYVTPETWIRRNIRPPNSADDAPESPLTSCLLIGLLAECRFPM